MSNFKYLYYFTSSLIDLAETKRLDLINASPSETYKWLLIHKSSGKIWELDFKSMLSEDKEYRAFLEGDLTFDTKGAELTLFGETFKLETRSPQDVPASVNLMITKQLTKQFAAGALYLFRDLRPSDLSLFKDWIFDEEVIRYSMTSFHRMTSEAQVTDWFKTTLSNAQTVQYGIVDLASGELIGYAGIAGLNDVDKNGEYFIFIGNKKFWGKGIATDVTLKIVKMGFKELHLHRIFLTASSKNPGAIKAYEKAGFQHEGIMREAFFRNNEFSDKMIMGILNQDFSASYKRN